MFCLGVKFCFILKLFGVVGGMGVGGVCLFVCTLTFQPIITVFCPDTRLTACTLKIDLAISAEGWLRTNSDVSAVAMFL